MAKAFWAALLAQRYPIVNDFIEFINVRVWRRTSPFSLTICFQDKGTVKGVNKDLWNMVSIIHTYVVRAHAVLHS
jgi:hypothetical protein